MPFVKNPQEIQTLNRKCHFLIDPSGCRLGQVALLQSFMATGWRSVEGVWPVVAATALLHRRAGQRGTISGAGGHREPYKEGLGESFLYFVRSVRSSYGHSRAF